MDSMSLAYGCPDLRILDLCGCVLIIDESVVALANRCVHLRSLGLYYCRNITDRAMYSLVQAVCDTFPALHTCSGRHSLVMSGCLHLQSVHCACILQSHETHTAFPHRLIEPVCKPEGLLFGICVHIKKPMVFNKNFFEFTSCLLMQNLKILTLYTLYQSCK
ncbi:PREDICTED: F-box protein SKP2B-like [Camelina sativa]|uniref:F-box protein SKP2B-like n=1 Tax=Camelina sativa TaxID=90675 RepID=A0ABM1QDX1_CAMSA|nr:PREDICTED: F-box protein SKP2B-like [Camelina sativa]